MSVTLNIGHTPNYATVTIGTLTLHFSYQTVIGFSSRTDAAISENVWGPTTGKHLNALDGGYKKDRPPRPEFEARLAKALQEHGL